MMNALKRLAPMRRLGYRAVYVLTVIVAGDTPSSASDSAVPRRRSTAAFGAVSSRSNPRPSVFRRAAVSGWRPPSRAAAFAASKARRDSPVAGIAGVRPNIERKHQPTNPQNRAEAL